ncbi:MAG: hypothetical protein RI958_2913 [Actinomycetota bacterium]|jgi:hypothetical protein
MTITYNRARGAASAEVDGDLVLISPVDRRCFSLNRTASAVWNHLPSYDAEGVVADHLVQMLTAAFRVDDATCRPEVVRLLLAMTEAGVVSSNGERAATGSMPG